ncbi:MAG: hypothetical protein U0931_35490 [Vulcanimicrobiota bacterium]
MNPQTLQPDLELLLAHARDREQFLPLSLRSGRLRIALPEGKQLEETTLKQLLSKYSAVEPQAISSELYQHTLWTLP